MKTSLYMLRNGEKAKITGMPPGMCGRRLEAIGLRAGKIVEKVSGMPFRGPITLVIDGRQIAIGHGAAGKILVETVETGGRV
ncbi:MAG: ferrous iron transport protein A [Thermovirgaceae bacterium]